MVPVRLELQNFLSYGTDVPPLEFDRFDVACLSGGNGEGKSALLDAMTWTLWGEARKSRGKRKPDDELIRIGSRHMEVTFIFELAETRYRVTRSFSRSASGKTTSSDLEFQVYAPEEDAYRPLTGSTQRETQARIEDTLGLDYDTFINSAFLLQGRSDEFTDKSPSERKEILVRILNLRRYEKLEDKARDRWREAKQRQQRMETEVERLKEAIADVPEWEDRQEEVEATLEERQETLQELRVREKTLTQERANLEAKAREADSLEATIDDLERRIEEKKTERDRLYDRIAEADELLADQAEIQSEYEHLLQLKEKREALDDQREQYREVQSTLEEARAELRDRTNELERTVDRLDVEQENLEERLEECEAVLEERPVIKKKVRAAQAARQQVSERSVVRERRNRLAERQEEARRALTGVREQLRGELESLQAQIEEDASVVETLEAVTERIDELEEARQRRNRLDEQLAEVEKRGKRVAQQIQERTGQLEARRQEKEREEAELERFREATGPTCPTCGTELTPDHREEVEATLESSVSDLEQHIQRQNTRLHELREQRSELRERYTALRSKREELEGVGEALATAREQKRGLEERVDALKTRKEKARRIHQQLEQSTYGAEYRRRWQWCAQRRAALSFDPSAFKALQNRAAQFDRYVDRLADIQDAAERREALREKLEAHEEERASLQSALEDETAFEDLRKRIDKLEAELDALDFDPDRFDEVREEIEARSDVSDKMRELERAQQNRDDWSTRLEQLDSRLEELAAARTEKQEQLSTLREELQDTAEIDDQLAAVEEEIEAAEAKVNDAQQTLGRLNERLQQAERDREALEEARASLSTCKENRQLYKHLRTAFGKHGIPSLIIEETLPEVEERANRILDRLTDGRMHVRLETLKEKKSGGTTETLDIIITDEQGVPRPYETFSGGESFRVNFALRVALAQLLAERSGVRVRTLVIDEGFGTQDEDGIERLVEAIQAIRRDFAKILVITHLPRLKKAFPVRIEVEKDPVTGSTFDLVGA